MIYIPHCTGDVYAGNSQLKNSSGKTMYFHGHKNMRAFLSRIAATFTKVKEVYISGSSAGGFGSSMNWWLAQEYFGNIKVHLLNDSGPPFDPKPGRYETWVKAWKLVTPTGCTDCDKSISNILTHYEKIFLAKGHKMGFLSYDRDQVIRLFFNHLDLKGDDFKADLYTLYDRLDKTQNTHYFGMAGTSHTMMGGAKTLSNKSGVVLGDWIKWMVEDDPKWKSYRQ
jgi:hypothetical protein